MHTRLFILPGILAILVLACSHFQSPPKAYEPTSAPIREFIYTQTILSNLNPPEIFAAQINKQIRPFLSKNEATLLGLFIPISLEEFAPFSRLKPDELIVMIAWKSSSPPHIKMQLNHLFEKLGMEPPSEAIFLSSTEVKQLAFNNPGFYVHHISHLKQDANAQRHRLHLENQWIFQEIKQDASKDTSSHSLVISRFTSYENWRTSSQNFDQNATVSISEALNQKNLHSPAIASQLYLPVLSN